MARNKALTATEGPVPDRGAKRSIGTLPTSYREHAAWSRVAFFVVWTHVMVHRLP